MGGKQEIQIKLVSYDPHLLEKVVGEIVDVAKHNNIAVNGPAPLPNRRWVFTVMKAAHVYKESNEQFGLCKHKRLLYLYPNSPKDIAMLSKMVIPSGVNIFVTI